MLVSLLFLACKDPAPTPLDLAEDLGPDQVRAGQIDDEAALFGGISAEGDGSVLMGAGSMLYRYAPSTGLKEVGSLANKGVIDITGLVYDELGGGTWVLEGASDQLIKFGFED